MRWVHGVDPSLSSTGFATITETGSRIILTYTNFRPTKLDATLHPAVAEAARVQELTEDVCTRVSRSELLLIEGIAYSSKTGKPAERAHLFYSIVAGCAARRVPLDQVAPTSLKKLVTGSGRVDKEGVIAAVRSAWSNYGWADGTNLGRSDRADAVGLAWVAATRCGFDVPKLP